MSEKDGDIVAVSEHPVPVEKLLKVDIELAAVILGYDTSVGRELTVVHVLDACAAGLIDSDSGVECEGEVLEELYLNV